MARLERLAEDFLVHCKRDAAKRCIWFPNLVLRSLNVWPDEDNLAKTVLIVVVIVSLLTMGAFQSVYGIDNITDIPKITSTCTTLIVVFETAAKLGTLMYYRRPLNYILSTIWHGFWPSHIANKPRLAEIRFGSSYVVTVGVAFLCMAFFSDAQFMMFPLLENVDQLPLASWFPFDFMSSPQYELLYIWQWFMNQIMITTLSGFDTFFYALVMICSTQFQVLQEVLETMSTTGRKRDGIITAIGLDYASEKRIFVTCIQHHFKLLEICDMLEVIFSHIVFMQYVISTMAMCVPAVALIADPDLWQHMLSYLIAHVLQFFIYCSVGNELTYQSGMVADSVYRSEWQDSQDGDFRKGLIMVILRAQRPVTLTVAGRLELSYANFIATVQLSFSFYTLLNSFV